MLLRDMPFARPFVVRMQCGLERKFLNTYDALDFLENEWPMRAGPSYGRAIEACRAALSGSGSTPAARACLVEACIEAGLELLTDAEAGAPAAIRAA